MLEKLPEWAMKMTDAEWSEMLKEYAGYTNCATCKKRLILTLSNHSEDKYYCVEHCPEHKWQDDYDWPTECGRCGILYPHYLQKLLEENHIAFSKP